MIFCNNLVLGGAPSIPEIINIAICLAFFPEYSAHLRLFGVNGYHIGIDIISRDAIDSFIGKPGFGKLKKMAILPAISDWSYRAGESFVNDMNVNISAIAIRVCTIKIDQCVGARWQARDRLINDGYPPCRRSPEKTFFRKRVLAKVANFETAIALYGATVAFYSAPVTNYNASLTFYDSSKTNYSATVAYYGAEVTFFSADPGNFKSLIAFFATQIANFGS